MVLVWEHLTEKIKLSLSFDATNLARPKNKGAQKSISSRFMVQKSTCDHLFSCIGPLKGGGFIKIHSVIIGGTY